ncbi:b58 [miniopterid betaherpesvirus 1]|uniref:B58 n=1 Tax=miniopterid betaherpesvirus 1 TaxID=3070189 RepID=I3VQ47_9BETA|nr:b58 [miniopterid betaherpesvirus 1]AFK83891.1 b58 [miniopterid betaherpesvirus 1]
MRWIGHRKQVFFLDRQRTIYISDAARPSGRRDRVAPLAREGARSGPRGPKARAASMF